MRIFSKLPNIVQSRDSIQFQGFPPELTGGMDRRIKLNVATYLLIAPQKSGVLLIRYDESIVEVGDTWHVDVEDAKHQIDYEYGVVDMKWTEIPDGIDNPVDFIREWLKGDETGTHLLCPDLPDVRRLSGSAGDNLRLDNE